jgi:hypothetical protein
MLGRSKEMNENNSAFPVFNGKGGADYSCIDGGLTARQYAAIHLKVPRSGDPELDAMIRDSRRADFAGQVLAGYSVCFPESGRLVPGQTAEWCHKMANAMLAVWEKEAGK